MSSDADTPTSLRVLGLDIAAINTGSAVVEAQISDNGIQIDVLEDKHHRTERMARSQPPSWESMWQVADSIMEMVRDHGVGHVTYEGFAKMSRRNNTTAYEHAELVGVIKSQLFAHEPPLTFLQVPPTTLNSFYGVKSGDKKALQSVLKEEFGWASEQRLVKWREDCSDAAGHAIVGSHVFATLMGYDLSPHVGASKARVLYGDDRGKSKMVGLLKRPQLYIPRDACIGEENGDGSG